MTKQKTSKKTHREFTLKVTKRKKTRRLSGSTLVEALAKIIEARRIQAQLAKV